MGTGVQTFTAPGGAHLNRNTRYFVHTTFGGSGTRPRWNLTANDNEDSGKAIGWSIGNHRYTRPSGETGSWQGGGGVYSTSIQIGVKGNTLAPAAPNLSATPGETEVTLTWGDPGNNTITKYQYRRRTGAGAYGNWSDISGSGASTDSYTVTGLTNVRADEEGTFARLRAHRTELVEPKIAEHNGRIVKLMGDGLLVEFASVVDAVRCATEVQRAMAARNTGVPEREQIVLRVGINLGDVIVEGDDIHGDGVNVAARMQEIAPPGGISVSGVVYDSVRDKLAPGFEDLGPQRVKNIAEPVRAYRVVLDPEATGTREAPQILRQVTIAAGVREGQRVLSILSGIQRQGTWRVPKKLRVVAVMGGIDLDFREAEFGPGVTEVNATMVMGAIAIIVPPHLAVECDGVGNRGRGHGRPGNLDAAAGGADESRCKR